MLEKVLDFWFGTKIKGNPNVVFLVTYSSAKQRDAISEMVVNAAGQQARHISYDLGDGYLLVTINTPDTVKAYRRICTVLSGVWQEYAGALVVNDRWKISHTDVEDYELSPCDRTLTIYDTWSTFLPSKIVIRWRRDAA